MLTLPPPCRPARLPSLLLLLLTGCTDDLAPADGPRDAAAAAPPVATERAGDSFQTTVDASRAEAWVRLDLEAQPAGEIADPASPEWDLAFQRFKIISNGGVSGTAGVEVAVLTDVDLAQVTAAPATGWLVDHPDGPDMNPDPDSVFNRGDDTWFAYDPTTHALSPRKRVYVVRTALEGYFAVQLAGYYNPAGTAGFVRFHWKPVAAPTGRVPAAAAP